MLLKEQFSKISKTAALLILFSFILTNTFAAQTYVNSKVNAAKKFSNEYPSLAKYATDLTALARDGKVSLNANLEREADLLVKSLTDNDSRQTVILDESGENQEPVVKLLASRIVKGNVPAALNGKRVFKLELDAFFADVKDQTEAAKRVDAVVNDLTNAKGNIILFVNELTNFVGKSQISDKFTESLLQGKVQIIGGSSPAAYGEKIESQAEIAVLFETISIGNVSLKEAEEELQKQILSNDGFRGDNVASDLREMMQNDKTGGQKRLDVILQAKDADNQVLRQIMAENNIRLENRIGTSDTMVVNLPLKAVEALAQSGLINYMSPDRAVNFMGHLENATGATVTRTQAATATRPAYTLDGTGVGIAVLDSGLLTAHKDFQTNGVSRVVYSQNFVTTSTTTDDDYGHGTPRAGIAAGNTSTYQGISHSDFHFGHSERRW